MKLVPTWKEEIQEGVVIVCQLFILFISTSISIYHTYCNYNHYYYYNYHYYHQYHHHDILLYVNSSLTNVYGMSDTPYKLSDELGMSSHSGNACLPQMQLRLIYSCYLSIVEACNTIRSSIHIYVCNYEITMNEITMNEIMMDEMCVDVFDLTK